MNIQKAIENGPVEIVDFPIKNGGSFHGKMLVHQRVIMGLGTFVHISFKSSNLASQDEFDGFPSTPPFSNFGWLENPRFTLDVFPAINLHQKR